MAAEYEANRNASRRSDIMQKSLRNDSSNDEKDTLEDLAGSANDSIIGKVKSRVSSIIPSSLSKWFSPTTRNSDSLNGSLSVGSARRRRRIEIEDDDEYINDELERNDDAVHSHNEFKENLSGRSVDTKGTDEDETDNESDDNLPKEAEESKQRPHYSVKTYGVVSQPPSKRSRISFDDTSVHQPLVASTPTIGTSHRNMTPQSSALDEKMSIPSTSHSLRHHYSETKAYNQRNLEQPGTYGSLSSAATASKTQENITCKPNNNEKMLDISSRRTLHLPSTSLVSKDHRIGLSTLNRQSLSGIRDTQKSNRESPIMNTTNTIIESGFYGEIEEDAQGSQEKLSEAKSRRKLNGNSISVVGCKKQKLNGTDEIEEGNADVDSASESSEGCVETISELPNNMSLGQRKPGLFNMSKLNSQNGNNSRTSSFGNGINFYSHLEGRKSLFSGRTHAGDPSNTLNNSTLSLTSLNRRQFNASIYGSTSALSDSRLLNTFSPFYKGKTTYGGAAAYKKYNSTSGTGSNRVCNITPTIIRPTSSLSTLSSSNNSLAAGNTCGNTSAMHSGGLVSNINTDNTSAISSTAKRILDLINDFATPLSEAKKMANTNVKTNHHHHPQILPQAKTRLNEIDLQTSRAIRLSQVRTPYTRPAVTLQQTVATKNTSLPPPVRELQVPSMSQILQMKKMQSTTERSRQITMQNSRSTTRSIVGGSSSGEYMLPIAVESNDDREYSQSHQQQQQQYTNKIKSKVRTSGRITASKNANKFDEDELPPPPINLPNIAFPLMQNVPTFDIALPKSQNVAASIGASKEKEDVPKLDSSTNAKSNQGELSNIGTNKINSNSVFTTNKNNATAFGIGNDNTVGTAAQSTSNTILNVNSNENNEKESTPVSKTNLNFKFSPPLTIAGVDANTSSHKDILTPVSNNFKFSSPVDLRSDGCSVTDTSPAILQSKVLQSNDNSAPQLKSGSVLDALKKSFTIPSTTMTQNNASNTLLGTSAQSGFGDLFKKSASNKWECETCLIHNENNLDKCVACETPRPSSGKSAIKVTTATPPPDVGSTAFGGQFKKPPNQWECEVCMIRNKELDDKCVACQTPRKGATTNLTTTANPNNPSSSWQSSSTTFGDTFKPKPNTWECPTCLINNKSDCVECVACQTENPKNRTSSSSSSSNTNPNDKSKGTTAFKFGFSAVTTNTTSVQSTTLSTPDTCFKSLAASQMSAKWECDACMTRNDAARNKCVCCEQAKPGSNGTPDIPSSGPKFTFGSTASNKFTFGFGANANANSASTSESSVAPTKTSTSITISNQKTDGGNTKGFVFGNATTTTNTLASSGASGSGFSFGIKPAAPARETQATNKSTELNKSIDQTDRSNNNSSGALSEAKTIGLKLATGSITPDKDSVNTTNSSTVGSLKFGNAECSTAAPYTTATTTTPAPVGKFSSTTSAATTIDPASNNTSKKSDATGGFTFGGNTITNATSQSPKSGFSFGVPAKTTDAESNKTATTKATATFSFGSIPASQEAAAVTSSVATSTAPVMPMFSFGKNITSTTTTAASTTATATVSASASTNINTTTASAFSNTSGTSGGFSFGSSSLTGAAKGSPTAKSLFGSFVPPTNNAQVVPSFAATSGPATAPANIFGTFGETSSSAKTSNTTSAAPSAANTNIFGAAPSANSDSKPTASATMIFGSAGNTNTDKAAVAANAPFVFGSSENATTQGTKVSNVTASGGLVAPATNWPKGGFSFGGSSAGESLNQKRNEAPQPVFGTFMNTASTTSNAGTNSAVGAGTSVFGGLGGANSTATGVSATFGSVAANASPMNPPATIFGAGTSTATASQQQPTANLFGNAGTTPASSSTFGASPSFGSVGSIGAGNSSNMSNNTSGFGIANTTTFGSFGSTTTAASATSTSADGASAAKKSEPAFNFGGSSAPQVGSGGGFNFGAQATATNKPAFNFTASIAPTFNFTGSSGDAAKPFQFGATPSAPAFNFSGGLVEATPNAPFQFNAGTAPASSNIFAPTPSAPNAAGGAMQARRKIRQPTRRLTPR